MASIITTNKLIVLKKNTFVPLANGEYPLAIPFKKELIFHDAPSYTKDDLGNSLTALNLADHSTINSLNGMPTGLPPNLGMGINQFGNRVLSWYNVGGSFNVIFDLGATYTLDYCYVYIDGSSNGGVVTWGSSDGVNYNKLSEPIGGLNQGKWVKIDFLNIAKAGNIIFKIGFQAFEFEIKGLVLYGRMTDTKLIKGTKLARKISGRKLNQSMGTNAFYFELPQMVGAVSGSTRFYVEPDWFMGDIYRRTGSAIGKTPNDLNYKFSTSHMGNIEQLLQGYANTGTKVMFTVTTSPVCLRSIGTADAPHNKPVDPGKSPKNLTVTTNPMNYTFMARIAWNIAARYGNNENADPQFINLQGDQKVRIGMGLIYCMEMGNEMDKWWLGEAAYSNPQEMAAYMSAIYDGHMGQMGPGFGIKNADPGMKVSMISFASGENTPYIREMLWWFDTYRGPGNYAFDVINYHYYNSSEGSQEVGDATAFGLQPEKGFLTEVNEKWSLLRDTYCQSAEVWLTEVGWDEHLGGVFSPSYPTQFERSRYKSYWLTRLFIVNEITGVDVTNQYWYSNTGGKTLDQYSQDEPDAGKFLTSGMVDGIQNSEDWNRKPLMSYFYVATLKKVLTNYRYLHLVMRQGIQNTEEIVINSNDSRIWAAAYINYITQTSMLVVWLDSGNMNTLPVTINNNIETFVELNNIDNAEIRKTYEPIKTEISVNNNLYNITITECPQFIETKFIGTPLPIPAERIESQVMSDGNIVICWLDRNINKVTARINRSTNPDIGFQTIYQGDTDNATYVDTTANPNLIYYYKVILLKDNSIPPDPNPEFDLNLNQYEALAGSVYYAANSIKYNDTITAINNDSVGKIIDKKGKYDLIYQGVSIPAVTLRPPILNTLSAPMPYITFENIPHIGYETNDFMFGGVSQAYRYPHAISIVMESLPGQDYEAWNAGGPSGQYIGNFGTGVRVGSSDSKYVVPNTTTPLFFRRDLMHVEFARDFISVWMNGVFTGKIINDIDDSGYQTKIKNMLGVQTNNANWNWFATYVWYNNEYQNLISNRNTILSSIQNKWVIGSMQLNPYAQNIVTTFNTTLRQWETNFDSVNATQDQILNASYNWYIRHNPTPGDGGNFSNQTFITSNKVCKESQYTNYLPDIISIYCLIKVGNWMFIKGPTKDITP